MKKKTLPCLLPGGEDEADDGGGDVVEGDPDGVDAGVPADRETLVGVQAQVDDEESWK